MDFSRFGWNYAKDGSRISQSEFQDLRDNHFETYARIGLDHVPGSGGVSTVWLGSDYGYGAAGTAPLQFESLVHFEGDAGDTDVVRYRSEEAARKGHAHLVECLKSDLLANDETLGNTKFFIRSERAFTNGGR